MLFMSVAQLVGGVLLASVAVARLEHGESDV
jgi:hypothetical protein